MLFAHQCSHTKLPLIQHINFQYMLSSRVIFNGVEIPCKTRMLKGQWPLNHIFDKVKAKRWHLCQGQKKWASREQWDTRPLALHFLELPLKWLHYFTTGMQIQVLVCAWRTHGIVWQTGENLIYGEGRLSSHFASLSCFGGSRLLNNPKKEEAILQLWTDCGRSCHLFTCAISTFLPQMTLQMTCGG